MRQIPTHHPSVNEIRQNAFNFIEIHGNIKPLENGAYLLQGNLMFFRHFVDTLKETAIAHGSAPFEQQVSALPSSNLRTDRRFISGTVTEVRENQNPRTE